MITTYEPTIRALLDLRGPYYLVEEEYGITGAARLHTSARQWELVEGAVVWLRDDAACKAAAAALEAAGCVAIDRLPSGAGHPFGTWQYWGVEGEGGTGMSEVKYTHHERRTWQNGDTTESHVYTWPDDALGFMVSFSFGLKDMPHHYSVCVSPPGEYHTITREEFEGHSVEAARHWRDRHLAQVLEAVEDEQQYTLERHKEERTHLRRQIAFLKAAMQEAQG